MNVFRVYGLLLATLGSLGLIPSLVSGDIEGFWILLATVGVGLILFKTGFWIDEETDKSEVTDEKRTR